LPLDILQQRMDAWLEGQLGRQQLGGQ